MKKAVCIGISIFENPYIQRLAGCVNDAMLMSGILKRHYGFTTGGTRVLTNENATKANILERAEWLVQDAQSGDTLVLTISSHGSFTIDRDDADDPDEELDGRDEVIVPFDFDKTNYILDDEICEILNSAPKGVQLYCILDLCHSGTAGMAFNLMFAPPAIQNRFLPPPLDILARLYDDIDWRRQPLAADDDMNRISIGACRDEEQALDIPTAYGNFGLLTLTLYQTLASLQGRGSVEKVFIKVKKQVSAVANSVFHKQTPELHGPGDLRKSQIFGECVDEQWEDNPLNYWSSLC